MTTPKPVLNNRIDYRAIGGIVNRLDTFVNQAVSTNSSPTFSNLQITGNTTIEGNLYVEGNTTIIDSLVSEYQDSILLLNNHELGAGVSLLQAGLEIDRGTLENYRIVYNETSKTFRVGVISNTQAVALRQDAPLNHGIMSWNNSTNLIESVNSLSIDISILSSTNSTNASSGSFYTLGGIGITKDLYINGLINMNGCGIYTNTSGNLTISSINNLNLQPGGLLTIPNNTKMIFGSTNQSIQYNSGAQILTIQSGSNINFTFVNGINKSINIPNQIPITFSTPTEKVYTDSSNNMVMASSQDIQLNPGSSKKVLIPLNTNLAFSNNNQYIVANAGGDLTIASGNNLFLNPNAVGGSIRIPTSNPIKFGNSGNQTIVADSNNNLNITSNTNINITSNNVVLSQPTVFKWAGNGQYNPSLNVDSGGNLFINTGVTSGNSGSTFISSTSDVTNSTNGSLIVLGGLNVAKTIYSNQNITLNSTNGNLSIKNNNNTILSANTSNIYGQVIIAAGDGTSQNPGMILKSNNTVSQNLLKLANINDTTNSYYIGRDRETSQRNININLPSYASDYNSVGNIPSFSVTTNDTLKTLFSVESDSGNVNIYGAIVMHSTQDSISSTSGSFILYGGLGVAKNITCNGSISCITNSTNAIIVNNANRTSGVLMNIDTINNNVTINTGNDNGNSFGSFNINNNLNINNYVSMTSHVVISDTTNSINPTTGALIVNGGVTINKDASIYGTGHFYNNINLHGNSIINVNNPINPTDVANKSYVDLIKQGLFVKDSVKAATLVPQTLNTDFYIGATIDSYVLSLGDRILIKNQANAIENGIYTVTNTIIPQRSNDVSIGSNASGIFVFVEQGFNNNNTGWICNSLSGNDIVGTNSITFTQFTGISQVVPGNAISIDTNTVNVNVDNSSIEIDTNNNLRLSSNIIGTGLLGGSGVIIQTDPNQSHVNQLGTILTGDWEASTVNVQYGGTGKTNFIKGTILYGNDIDPIASSDSFIFDDNNNWLGLGINIPQANLHISSLQSSSILLDADTENINPTSAPSISLQYQGKDIGILGINRTNNQFAINTFSDALVIGNNLTSGNGIIQFSTNKRSRLTILQNGNIGINTSNPGYTFDINGSIRVSNGNILTSGLTIYNSGGSNAIVAGNMTINGGLTLNGTFNTSGIITFNGVGISSTIDSTNSTNGSGALSIAGGASIVKSLYVGGDVYFNNFLLNSQNNKNYIQSPDNLKTPYSFQSINFIKYSDYNNPITTFTNKGIVLNTNNIFQIGGSESIPDGYSVSFNNTSNNLNIIPANISSIGTLNIGTTGNLSNINLQGRYGHIYWNSNDSIININNSILQLANLNSNSTLSISLLGTTSNTIISGNNANCSLSVSVPFTLSNTSGSSMINYVTNNDGTGDLSVSTNVTSTFNGPVIFNDNILRLNNNTDCVTLANNENQPAWIYIGELINNTCLLIQCVYNDIIMNTSFNITNGSLITSNDYQYGSGDFILPRFCVYKTSSNNYHSFALIPSTSQINLTINGVNSSSLVYVNEGTNVTPDGSYSMYSGTWVLVYDTNISAVNNTIYSGKIYTNELYITNNIPIISYNNTSSSVDTGISFQRYQTSNDTSLGDIVNNDQYTERFILESQIAIDMNQTKLTGSTPINNYYKNWWIVFGTQVRQIVYYNSNGMLLLDSNWTTQPQVGDTVNLYANSYVVSKYNENNKCMEFGFAGSISEGFITLNDTIDIKSKNLYTLENIYASGTITIYSTSDVTDTSSSSLNVLGGCSISKSMYIGTQLGIGTITPQNNLHINTDNYTETNGSGYSNGILLEGNTNNPTLTFANSDGNYLLSLNNTNNTFGLYYNDNSIIISNTSGYVGINITSSNSLVTPLVLENGNFIAADNNNSYIGINGGNSNTINDGNAQLIVYGSNNTSGNNGNIIMYLGHSSGSFNIYNTNDSSPLLSLSNNGDMTLTSGSLTVSDNIYIMANVNANSTTTGSCVVHGGVGITNDTYIGGNLNVSGSLNASGAIIQPSLSFNNKNNCNINSYNNTNLMTIASQNTLTSCISIVPTGANQDCSFQITLPNKINNLSNRGDCIVSVSGWSNDTSSVVTPLFNVIGVGVPNTTNIQIQFQSISSNLHYIQINCVYSN